MPLTTPTNKPFENSDRGNIYLAMMQLAFALDPGITPPDPTDNLNDPTLKPFENTDEGNIYLAWQNLITAFANSMGNKIVYIASLDQATTAAPTATVLINIFGEVPAWSRVTTGTYRLTFSDDFFPDSSRVVMQANASTLAASISCTVVSSKVIEIVQADFTVPGKADGMVNVGFTLEVYP